MSPSPCIICQHELRFFGPYRLAHADSKFQSALSDRSIYICNSCGTKQCDHRSIDLQALHTYYESSYRTEVAAGVGERQSFIRRAIAVFGAVQPYLPSRAMPLDIFEAGAGYCDNLLIFARNLDASRLATDEINSSLVSAAIHYEQFFDRPRDVVILSHVLEHIPDPRRYLTDLGEHMTPGGVLYIEVPNDVDRGLRFNRLHEPHVTFFDEKSLRHLLSEALPGFSVRILGTAGIRYWQYNPIGRTEKLGRKFSILWFQIRNILFDGVSSRTPPVSIYRSVTEDVDRIWLRAVLVKENA
jgi:SAM-dependent methyltransferase